MKLSIDKQEIHLNSSIDYIRGSNFLRNKHFMKRINLLLIILFIFTTQARAAQTVVSINDFSVEPGNDASASIMLNADNNAGSVTISSWNSNVKSRDVVFTDVKFHALGSNDTLTPLTLDVTTL